MENISIYLVLLVVYWIKDKYMSISFEGQFDQNALTIKKYQAL
jgi:hypothetical protein